MISKGDGTSSVEVLLLVQPLNKEAVAAAETEGQQLLLGLYCCLTTTGGWLSQLLQDNQKAVKGQLQLLGWLHRNS